MISSIQTKSVRRAGVPRRRFGLATIDGRRPTADGRRCVRTGSGYKTRRLWQQWAGRLWTSRPAFGSPFRYTWRSRHKPRGREDDGGNLRVETPEQTRLRRRSGSLALIGLAVIERGIVDGDDVVVEIDAWQVGAALEAADDAGLLQDALGRRAAEE
jgi:hypothetical protein